MPNGCEDFDITGGKFITAQGSKLLSYNLNNGSKWQTLKDFSDGGIKNINRPSIYKNKIIFINNK